VHVVCGPPGPGHQEDLAGTATTQVLAPVSLLSTRTLWADARAAADLVSFHDSDLPQRPAVLRFETTINNTSEFKVFRTTATDPDGKPMYLRLRKGVADLYRRTQVSQAANDRLAAANATTSESTKLAA